MARHNAFKHGLAVKQLPELLARLGEAPEDFEKHLERVHRVFRSWDKTERDLVRRLARATWRRMRIFRAQARYEEAAWRKFQKRSGKLPRITPEDLYQRVVAVSRLLFRAQAMETEMFALERRIERILTGLLRARGRAMGNSEG